MLAGRRTLRRRGESAARLAVVATTRLSQHDAEPRVARRDDDPTRQRDLAVGEVADRLQEGSVVAVTHLRTVAWTKPTRQTDERSEAARLLWRGRSQHAKQMSAARLRDYHRPHVGRGKDRKCDAR